MRAFNTLWSLDCRSLHRVNEAYIILLKKKEEPKEIKDFRPISLLHSFGKLVSKVLSLRLAPKLDELILANQSAFIKGRTIHDCFRMVQLTCRWLMQKKMSTVFLKIDLARAFDSVSWQFLLELLESLGFSRRWRDWLAGLLFLASSKVLLNG